MGLRLQAGVGVEDLLPAGLGRGVESPGGRHGRGAAEPARRRPARRAARGGAALGQRTTGCRRGRAVGGGGGDGHRASSPADRSVTGGGWRRRARRRSRRGRRGAPCRALGVFLDFDDPRAEQSEEALLGLLGGQRDQLDDLARRGRAVHPREHEAVGGGQGELLEAQQRIVGQGQGPADVAEGVADHVGVLDGPHRLEDQLAGRQLEGELAVDRALGALVELVGALVPGEDLGQDLPDVEGDRVLEAVSVEEPQLDEHLAQPLLLRDHDLGGPLEVVRGDEAAPHQDLAEMVLGDARCRR